MSRKMSVSEMKEKIETKRAYDRAYYQAHKEKLSGKRSQYYHDVAKPRKELDKFLKITEIEQDNNLLISKLEEKEKRINTLETKLKKKNRKIQKLETKLKKLELH